MADKVPIPSSKEIGKLPRWVQVAFAIRCARRVQPVFKAMWPDAPDEHVAAIEHAIQCAERLLVGSEGALPAKAAYAAAKAADEAAYAAYRVTAPFFDADPCGPPDPNEAAVADAAAAYAAMAADKAAAAEAAVAAYAAKAAAAHAAAAAYAAWAASATRCAASYAAGAAMAAALYDTAAAAHAHIRWDFETLMVLGEREHWNDQTRPSLESLPPLWLEGEEPNWKEIARRARQSTDTHLRPRPGMPRR